MKEKIELKMMNIYSLAGGNMDMPARYGYQIKSENVSRETVVLLYGKSRFIVL